LCLLDMNWTKFIQLYQKGTFEVRWWCCYMVVDILMVVEMVVEGVAV
jgi:hypothetical protein